MTNADKIRNFSNNELEVFMLRLLNCGGNIALQTTDTACRDCEEPFCEVGRENRIIDWLQKEVEE